jgi:AcrR family transcriptional regulator
VTATDATGESGAGWYRQRRRTRAAIVAGAAELLQSGVTPSVGEIADAADVSRRTVYTYFPTLEQLLLDATLGCSRSRRSTTPSTRRMRRTGQTTPVIRCSASRR